MSIQPSDRHAEIVSNPETKREVLDPFNGPADLLTAVNELCRGYMAQDRDDYYMLVDHHGEWLRLIDEHKKLVLNCHRDGLKTTIVLAYLCLRLEYDAGYRAIWAMNNQDLATEKAHMELNRMIERNEWLTNLNGERVRDTVKKKEWSHGSTLRSGWLDGGIDGDRAHLLVLDDLIKAKGDGKQKDIREWIEGTAFPMVKDGGRTVLVGTRKKPSDIYAHYRELPAYSVAEFPAILDVWDLQHSEADNIELRRPDEKYYTAVDSPWGEETIKVLWPAARGADWLASKRNEMADFRFWREYCLSFIGGTGDLVKVEDINRLVENGGCSIRGQSPPHQYTAQAGEAVVVSHDPAQSPTGDNAAFLTMRVDQRGHRRVLDSHAEKGMMPSRIKEYLADVDDRYDPALIVIEDNGIQQYVKNDAIEFSQSLASKIVPVTTTGKKHSWENGIPRLRTLTETGRIQLYRGDKGIEDFVDAALSLELEDGKLIGHTPDLMAAWYMAEQGIRRMESLGMLQIDDELNAEQSDANTKQDEPKGSSDGVSFI